MTKVGRPKKEDGSKVEYQLIAVHIPDYNDFVQKAESAGVKKVQAFKTMVRQFDPSSM